jgi:hypothetical protein
VKSKEKETRRWKKFYWFVRNILSAIQGKVTIACISASLCF